MSNLNWCTYCDNAINSFSNSLYCSEECLRSDALNHHPLLGYDYAELKDFPRSSPVLSATTSSSSSTRSLSPLMSPTPSFKEPSNFNLNFDQGEEQEDSVYQHIYLQKPTHQKQIKKNHQKPIPIYLQSWTVTHNESVF
ncbi:uncharacterized protein B0P05DRAFT_521813 [Gilbertella persicaria]|uniref:uncharacterized protein n=1 Tax=Gilbertella persicaria TaxID=101096 RepID=UPI0022206084|nr:uncharacterized protein B0P05DRAFT_521813 [Gilbertella persicaria]KAI8098408.1 hypothetical protein B0P05DRAFT_521813 [Gilbertella persicaria]